MRKIGFGVVAVAMLSMLLVGGILAVARAGQDAYACVSIVALDSGSERVLDLNTGLTVERRGSVPVLPPQPAVASWPSPDGQWVAYARPVMPAASQAYVIYAAPVPGVPPTDDAATLLIQTVGLFDLGWAHDGQRIALLWRDAASGIFLTTIAPDGTGRIDRQVPSGSANDVRFHGWSADGRFLATSSGVMAAGGESLQVWRTADGSTVAPGLPPAGLPLVEHAVWAPVGTRLAYLRGNALSTRARLVVVAPDEQPVEADLDLLERWMGRLRWSPDGQRLALTFFDGPNLRLSVFDMRGGTLLQSGNAVIASRLTWPVSSVWSADSRSVIFWGDRPGARDLAAYLVDEGRIERIVADAWLGPGDPLTADPNPDTAGGPRRIVVAFRTPNGALAADMMDVDGANRARLFYNARTAGDAIWSPDGQIAVIRWTTQDGLAVQPWLTWARRDGSDLHHLQDVGGEYVDLAWLPDGRRLVYVLSERGRLSVEVLDLEQNVRFQLVRGLDEVHAVEVDAPTGQLRFWWRNARGESGTDAFTRDAAGAWTRLYRYRVPTPLAGDYRLERAPAGPYALLIPSGGNAQGPTFLATDDGVWSRQLDAGAKYSMRVGWSPDGARLALVLDSLVLRVFDVQGDAIHHTPLVGPFDGVPELTRCD